MRVACGVHMIPGIRWSRVWLIEGDDEVALVDAGPPWASSVVADYLRSIGRGLQEVSLILMTHAHPDHFGGAASLRLSTGARIVAHPADCRRLSDGTWSLSYLGAGSVPVPVPFLRRTPVDLLVGDGDVLPFSRDVRVLHTPGHSPGSLCYLLERDGILFSGDTLFSDGRKVARSAPFPKSDRSLYRCSVARLAALEFDVLCGGHGRALVGSCSSAVRELVKRRPEPPGWGHVLARLAGRTGSPSRCKRRRRDPPPGATGD